MANALPIVLIPGLNGSARLFSAQIPALWRFGHVTVVDHRHGELVAEIAAGLLATLPPSFALVGFSFGGYVAFEMIRQAGERVKRLALVDTSSRPDTHEQAEGRRERIRMAQAGRFLESLELQFRRAVHPSRHDDEALRKAYCEIALECGPEALVRHCLAAIARPDSRADLAQIRCPTAVIVGDSDPITPPAQACEMADGVAGARLTILPQSGHLTPLERPDLLTAALVDWLDG